MISVIVNNYNYADYIGDCIKSLLSQKFSYPYEIVIIDDGSVDHTRDIIRKFRDDKIRVYYQKNAGQFNALSNGVRKAIYDLVCFCDSDDTFHPEKLDKVYGYFIKYPEIGMIMHNAKIFGDNDFEGKLHPIKKPLKRNIFYPKQTAIESGIHVSITSCLCFRKEVIDKLAFFNSSFWHSKHYGDILFRSVGFLKTNSLFIKEVLTNYRVHPNSHHINNINKKAKKNYVLQRLLIEFYYICVNEFLASVGEKQISLCDNPRWRKLAYWDIGYENSYFCNEKHQIISYLKRRTNFFLWKIINMQTYFKKLFTVLRNKLSVLI